MCFSVWLLNLEIPAALGAYWYFNHILRPGRLQPYLAALPVFYAYIWYDAYYFAFDQPFRLTALHELPALVQFLSPTASAALGAAAVIPPLFFLSRTDWRARRASLAAGILGLGLFCGILRLFPGIFAGAVTGLSISADALGDHQSGRIITALAAESQRRLAVKQFDGFRNDRAFLARERERAAFVAAHSNGHNVHLIIMESLLDPTLFENLKLSRDPYSPQFRELFGGRAGLSESPIFGGGTAQAEFEVLCGSPALRRLGHIEFNSFTGPQTPCLPNILNQSGYRTISSQLVHPALLNVGRAYKAMGFRERYFPDQYSTEKTYCSLNKASKTELTLFDGDFFSQNLDFLGNTGKPVFNCLVTMYGHFPYYLDETKRPGIITARPSDPVVNVVASQFFYRTRAMADFVTRVNAREPHSLIIMVGDHLPVLLDASAKRFDLRAKTLKNWVLSSREKYEKLGYLPGQANATRITRIFIMRDGKPVVYPLIHHYDIPGIVLDYVTDGAYCKRYRCGHLGQPPDPRELKAQYMHLMAQAL
ncbi:MAG: sulfatase-like hydrolase/transferase [Elusimicrobiaceae bacterium]|nr:sulfatase-like hydrolase/transferase [Elusimicrobiaceae bacterium]